METSGRGVCGPSGAWARAGDDEERSTKPEVRTRLRISGHIALGLQPGTARSGCATSVFDSTRKRRTALPDGIRLLNNDGSLWRGRNER